MSATGAASGSRRRILIVSPYPPPPDGIGIHTHNLATAWAREHDVLVVALAPSRGEPATDSPATDSPATDSPATFGVTRILSARPRSFALVRALARDWRPDIVYVQFALPALKLGTLSTLALCHAARRRGAVVMVAYHEAIREFEILGPLAVPVYRAMAAASDVTVVHSPVAASELRRRRIGHDTIHVVPLGVRVSSTRVAARRPGAAERNTLLSVGFTHPHKGIEVLIDAMPLVTETLCQAGRPAPRLVVAGQPKTRHGLSRLLGRADRRYHDGLKQQASALAGRATIDIVPYLAEDELAAALASAAMMVLPYRRITQSAVATLALEAGLPTVASDLEGLRVLEDAALFAQPGDVDGLARAISRVLLDHDVRSRLESRARDLRHRQTFDRVTADLVDLAQAAAATVTGPFDKGVHASPKGVTVPLADTIQ